MYSELTVSWKDVKDLITLKHKNPNPPHFNIRFYWKDSGLISTDERIGRCFRSRSNSAVFLQWVFSVVRRLFIQIDIFTFLQCWVFAQSERVYWIMMWIFIGIIPEWAFVSYGLFASKARPLEVEVIVIILTFRYVAQAFSRGGWFTEIKTSSKII